MTDSSSGQGRGTLNAGNSNGPGERTLSGIHPTRLVTLTRRSPQARTQPVLFPFSDFGGGQWKMVERYGLFRKRAEKQWIVERKDKGSNSWVYTVDTRTGRSLVAADCYCCNSVDVWRRYKGLLEHG